MKIEDFDYNLPKRFIAQYPLADRKKAKLLVFLRDENKIYHRLFQDMGEFLDKGDLLILNDSGVRNARLFARRQTGAQIEIFVLSRKEDGLYVSLLRPARRVRDGETLILDGDRTCTVVNRKEKLVRFNFDAPDKFFEEHGVIPLPPYIKRREEVLDYTYYQTVFLKEKKSVAAHTAGLHFDRQILSDLQRKGVDVDYISLHMGKASFKPLSEQDLERQTWEEEEYSIPGHLADRIKGSKYKRMVLCGTSVVRALETFCRTGQLQGRTTLLIKPGFDFQVTKSMITNFHYPRSSHLFMLSALLGREKLFDLYEEAKKNNYRFLSYGDAMMVI